MRSLAASHTDVISDVAVSNMDGAGIEWRIAAQQDVDEVSHCPHVHSSVTYESSASQNLKALHRNVLGVIPNASPPPHSLSFTKVLA